MHRVSIVVASLVLTVSLAGYCAAQGGMGGGGRGRQAGPRVYDPKTVETLSGEVVSVEKVTRRRGAGGIHVMLKTDKETIAVHLGPSWYLQEHLPIAAKDHIEVRGSRVTSEGHPAIIAAEVKKGDQTLKLREDDGRPLWRGGKKP
jgi:hypothetical protein